jgi:sugar O-acyltransferase (sialic acid O-acetyltransferase NeuD family)
MNFELSASNFQLLLIGAGGHCRSCIDVIEQEGRFEIAGIVDKGGEAECSKLKAQSQKNTAVAETEVLGYPIIGTDDDLPELRKKYCHALVTVGQIKSPDVRIRLHQLLLSLGFELPTIISPLAYVSRHAKIGQGTVIMHHALVNAGAVVGENCIINTKALVEHDAVIEDHCHIATGTIVNGAARIGSGCFLGSGCQIKEGITLDDNCLVGMGTSVRKNQRRDSRVRS